MYDSNGKAILDASSEDESFSIEKAALCTGLAVFAVLSAVACVFVIRRIKEKKEVNGNLVKVNYKFSKEFD